MESTLNRGFIEKYATVLGPYALSTYVVIATEAIPLAPFSLTHLAKTVSLSLVKTKEAIAKLITLKLIEVKNKICTLLAPPDQPVDDKVVVCGMPTAFQELWDALAALCGIGDAKAYGQSRFAKEVHFFNRELHATIEQVMQFAQWWRYSDFRGKQGQRPTIAQIRVHWHQALTSSPTPTSPKQLNQEQAIDQAFRQLALEG